MDDYKLTKIFIKNLNISCFIGVTALERSERQAVLVNVIMWVDAGRASETDNIEETVDYKDLYLKIIKLTDRNKYNLLERLAEEIAKMVLDNTRVKKVELRVEKPKVLEFAESAGVEIVRIKK